MNILIGGRLYARYTAVFRQKNWRKRIISSPPSFYLSFAF
ncbi:hypothetical protein CLOSTHATH_03237 [Hungatella hathewayi DSM 13479]|uniref:Uncharacterized protein n=1 Tax=Hungatella hathewayi DSM 13479 TaxID=566550 RepID=D3AHZ8_9FIRM|nr:hypothetical protein CLOSTHATH_03237 [Hungatella hathewayi DSM 13479]